MKKSIRAQILTAFLGVIFIMFIIVFILNNFFLQEFYISNVQDELKEVHALLEENIAEELLLDEEKQEELLQLVEKSNISYLVLDNQGTTLMAKDQNPNALYVQLAGYVIGKRGSEEDILEIEEDYVVMRSIDTITRREYVEMWGNFENGCAFIIRTPIEGIESSVQITNQFLLYIGIAVLLVSLVLGWYLTDRFTKPVLELVRISKKMANLDFEAKYSSGGEDEIGMLGESFNEMSGKLQKAISDLKTANNELLQDIEKKEELENMRIEFLSNVSHELKTPIALVQGYAEGLKDGIVEDEESRAYYCEVIMDEADKMNKLVKNLLSLNQIEFGKDEVHFERFEVTELVQGVLQSLELIIEQKDVKVLFDSQKKVFVWGDQFKIEQVIRNYLTNALNHVNEEKLVEIKVERGQKVKISVFNSGRPIPEADIDHIWEKFYKVDKARTREYGGNGIGLSIVKAILESHHQRYGVENYKNGVEFWFELDEK